MMILILEGCVGAADIVCSKLLTRGFFKTGH
jgi:hypothetical protein